MSQLSAFLNPVAPIATESEFVISNRFIDENKKPIKWKLKPISESYNQELKEEYRDKQTNRINSKEYEKKLIVTCVIYPNLSDKDLCNRYNTINPMDVAPSMLLPGEYDRLLNKVLDVCGFVDLEEGIDKEIKN